MFCIGVNRFLSIANHSCTDQYWTFTDIVPMKSDNHLTANPHDLTGETGKIEVVRATEDVLTSKVVLVGEGSTTGITTF